LIHGLEKVLVVLNGLCEQMVIKFLRLAFFVSFGVGGLGFAASPRRFGIGPCLLLIDCRLFCFDDIFFIVRKCFKVIGGGDWR